MRYRAFISYASADGVVAARIQQAIERYRIPRGLRSADRGQGPVPTRLTPLFRDRSDAEAGGSLTHALSTALERSDALIVLCSPAAARSEWVGIEILRFKALGRSHRIFPIILTGSPERFDASLSPEGAFPPALFQRVNQAGALLDGTDPEPLAADIRLTGDGFELAKLKVVAGLTGIPLTELTQRQFEAERRERLIVRAIAGVMTGLAIVAAVAALLAYYAADAARTRLSNAIEMAARRVDDGARFGDEYGVPSEVIRQLLTGAERDFEALIGTDDTGVPALELQRGRLLVLFSRLYRAVGDTTQQLARARDAVATLDRVPARRRLTQPRTWLATLPTQRDLTGEQLSALEALTLALADTGDGSEVTAMFERGRALAAAAGRHDYVARFWSRIGEQRYLAADLTGARAAQDASLAELDAHLADDTSAVSVSERAAALSDRAELLLESERPQEALADQARVVAMFEAEAKTTPSDGNVLQSLGHALTRHADMQYAVTGTWAASVPEFERALELFERAHAGDLARADYARDLSIGLERLGDVMLQTSNVPRAGALFARVVQLRRDRVARDPKSAEAQRDLAVGLERSGDVLLAGGRAERALDAFDEARALRLTAQAQGTPARADPVLERDLAVLWYKTGVARSRGGAGAAWREAYESAIRLMQPLIEQQNTPPGWLRDVAAFRFSYAGALAKVGLTQEARTQWTTALELVDRQLVISPQDPRLLADRAELRSRLEPQTRR